MNKNVKLLIGILAIALIAGLFYFLNQNKKVTSEEVKEVIVLKAGYLKHPGYLPLFCANELGFLESDNLKVELIPFQSSPAIIAAFNSDQIQIAPMATASALSLESLQPGSFKVFAVSSETTVNYLTSIVISSKLSKEVESVSDLKGKKLGVFPGPAAKTLFSLVLENYGLEVGKDIFLQELGPPLHVQALQSGQVDGLATYEPYGTQAELQIGAVKLLPGAVEQKVLSPTQGGSWLLSNKTITEHPEIVLPIVDAIERSIDYINKNRDSLPEIISKYASVDLEVAKKAPIVQYSIIGQNIDLIAYQKYSDIMFQNKVISREIKVQDLLLSTDEYK